MTVWDGNFCRNSLFGMTAKNETDAFSARFFLNPVILKLCIGQNTSSLYVKIESCIIEEKDANISAVCDLKLTSF